MVFIDIWLYFIPMQFLWDESWVINYSTRPPRPISTRSPDSSTERNVTVQVPLLGVLWKEVIGIEFVRVRSPNLLIMVQRVHAYHNAAALGYLVAV